MSFGQQVLDCPLKDNEYGCPTIRDYLKKLLLALMNEEEGFSGKRPFGNSGWQNELVHALVQNGLISGESKAAWPQFDEAIQEAINAL